MINSIGKVKSQLYNLTLKFLLSVNVDKVLLLEDWKEQGKIIFNYALLICFKTDIILLNYLLSYLIISVKFPSFYSQIWLISLFQYIILISLFVYWWCNKLGKKDYVG